jgi:hypothetical protein
MRIPVSEGYKQKEATATRLLASLACCAMSRTVVVAPSEIEAYSEQ